MSRIAALKAERSTLLAEARAIVSNATAGATDAAKVDVLMNKADGITAMIRTFERAEAFGLQAIVNRGREIPTARLDSTFDNDIRLIRAYATANGERGGGAMPPDIQAEWNSRQMQPRNAAGTSPGTAGGYTVAPEFFEKLIVAMKSQGAMRSVASSFTSETGAHMIVPQVNDLSQSGRLLGAENVQLVAATDVSFAAGGFDAWTYTSDILPVSLQLLQDSLFDLGKFLLAALGSRLSRATNPHYTVGTGTGQPLGVVTSAAAGPVGATGSATSVSFDSLLALVHSVDPAYRVNGRFMMHDTTLLALRDIKDSAGRPIFQTYDAPGAATTTSGGSLFGYPVVINQDMPVMAANARSILFGDFSNYLIRDVVDLRLQMLKERFADYLQVAFIAAIRTDGKLQSAASPIRCYTNSAS